MDAVWAGLISLKAAKRFHLLVMLTIAAVALFAPAGAPGEPLTEQVLAWSLADARGLARGAMLPLASAAAYSLALVAALAGAVSLCLTRAHVRALRTLTAGRSVSSRAIVVLGLAIVNAVPYFAELQPWDGQYSAYVSRAMGESRLFLLIACEGLYIGCTATLTWVLYELTNAAKAMFRGKIR